MAVKKKRNRREFVALTVQDFTIRDDAGIIGHLRVKPNAVGWKAKGKQDFDQISIEQLAELAAEYGKKVKN